MEQVIEEIVQEVKKLDELEQQILLTSLRVKQMNKQGVKHAANPTEQVEPLSMEEISRYTHEVRKLHAGK
jgi:hypothetical protein